MHVGKGTHVGFRDQGLPALLHDLHICLVDAQRDRWPPACNYFADDLSHTPPAEVSSQVIRHVANWKARVQSLSTQTYTYTSTYNFTY